MDRSLRIVRAAFLLSIFLGLSAPLSAASAQSSPTTSESVDDSCPPAVEERLRQQEELIRALQKRLEELEAIVRSSSPPAEAARPEEAAEAVSTAQVESGLGEVRETTEVLSGHELVSDEFPASWPLFGTSTRMKIGGYLKTDFVFDLDGTLDKNQFLMSTIPVEGTPEYGDDGYFAAFAKESRVNIDVRRIKPGAPPLRGFVEGDFFTTGNQFRLRHAYVAAGNFLAGQTWTTLSFLESLPFMIDFAAGDALFGGRSTQLRYSRTLSESWKMAVAAEGLDQQGIANPNGLPGKPSTQLPLFAARAEYRWDRGVLFMGSSVAQLHWDGGATAPSDDAVQFNVVFAGRLRVSSASYFTWNTSYGIGSGENIIAFAGSDANAVLDADGTIRTMPAFSLLFGFGHEWSAKWSSNLSYAYGWLDTPEERDPWALKRGGIGHLNLIWKPVSELSTGIEFIWGSQRVQNDALGSAERVQLMAKYDF